MKGDGEHHLHIPEKQGNHTFKPAPFTTGLKLGMGFNVVELATGGMNEMYATLSAQKMQAVSVPSKGRKGGRDANDGDLYESFNPRPIR